ncbi:membrane protein insertase YidC [Fructobacillus sp. M158]|uniref:membrane protein insertase YidC n=1 Tax=Fructobacillus parabroussonetiae TaxID=2713174 RepID=UPI00200A7AC4|nr:membrane protein insertase YidC [Fructobacillus parabroussonetiae]MCK8617526.1 membrane protein insertase YidC [Fructobacillus parabroussonetiae]
MAKINKWVKTIGWLPLLLAGLAIVGIIAGDLSYDGHVPGTGLWGGFVAFFIRSILGVSSWFSASYGMGIVLFTIFIRFFILPLMVYQMDSMKKMQVLQPQLKVLQEKYAGRDTETRTLLAQEQQALYKEHGVSPFASMLPLLVQMPVLIALYQGIHNSSVLRSGSFLWLNLGNQDPYFVLPVLAALFTFGSSWLSTQANPQQNAMTKILPFVFPFIIFFTSLAVPSAVSLYWVVGNLFQMIQTFFLQNPFKLKKEREAAREKEKARARKLRKATRSKKR